MKKWTNLNKSKEKQKAGNKTKFKKASADDITNASNSEIMKKNTLMKQLKEYDSIRLEAVKMQRDACKLEYENALLENESLKKENLILDLQLEAANLQLSIIQAQVEKTNSE